MMWPNFLTLRNTAEQLRRLTRLVDEAPQASDDRLRSADFIHLPASLVRPENRKRSKVERDPRAIDTLVGHVTDVRGGFGVQKWGPDGWKTWAKALMNGDVSNTLRGDLHIEIGGEGGGVPDDEMARALALCSRYAQTPYHALASPKLGEIANRPFEHRTYAAGAGNGGVSMAMDCRHRESISEAFAQAGRNMVRGVVRELRATGNTKRLRYTVHGQWSRQRWNDTHREAHLAVYKPAILELQAEGEAIYIDYEHSADGGRPLTTRDDPDAHFDTKGRRVRTPEGEPL